MEIKKTTHNVTKTAKRNGNPELRPFIFITDDGSGKEQLYETLRNCVQTGVGGIIPMPRHRGHDEEVSYADELFRFREFYAMLLPECARLGVRTAFTLADCVQRAVISAEEDRWEYGIRSRRLERRAHYCVTDEHISLHLNESPRMSLVAFNEDRDEIIDLRGKDKDGILEWDTPRGNWQIIEYVCIPDEDNDRPDILSYEASEKFLDTAFELFADLLEPYMGKTVTHFYFHDLAFDSRNRHDWTENFNEVFAQRFGFDPAPYYPYLFVRSGNYTDHYKAMFSDCRARMLRDGFLLAAERFAEKQGLVLFGGIAEPKLTECPPVTGDALLDNTASPCAVFDRAYLYGMNSVKLAAGAAFGRSIRDIFVELYRSYPKYDYELLIRDASHAFARGANLPAIHMPKRTAEDGEEQRKLFNYIAAVRNYLARGRQVSDVAVIYPIYSLHSAVNLYDADIKGFEYPETPYNADYMSVINSICLYSGHDVTLLHPDVVARSARAENGMLRLDGLSDEGGFRVVVFPAQKFCSLGCMRVLRDYFDKGGKIVATGELPSRSLEFDPADPEKYDREMQQIVDHIFGEAADNPAVMREFCYNRGKNGGESYFLYFSLTAADGTNMVSSHTIDEAFDSLGVNYDVYAPEMPRFESTGALNNPYNEFTRLGLQRHLPGGGMFSHIHKRYDKHDIYFFANTTDSPTDTPVFLRGAHAPLCYDPQNEKRWQPDYKHVVVGGSVYTRFDISLPRSGSLIAVTENSEEREAEIDVTALPDMTDEARGKGVRKKRHIYIR